MFVNSRLAVDLGGIHTASAGTVTISNANAHFGLTTGNVYEIVVFQAERQKTLVVVQADAERVRTARSASCAPTCGDRVVTAGEQCDNGTAMNLGGYNQCTAQCRLGPYLRRRQWSTPPTRPATTAATTTPTAPPAAAAPVASSPPAAATCWCRPNTARPATTATGNTGAYGWCTTLCQRAGYCGDGMTQSPQESCDDGANDGSYGTCGDSAMPLPNCGPAPRCGDGMVQDAYGEQCEPAATNDPTCTPPADVPASAATRS